MNRLLMLVACVHIMILYSMDQSGGSALDEDEKENIIEQYECLNKLMQKKLLLFIERDSIALEDGFFDEKYEKIGQKIDQINQEIVCYYRKLKMEQLLREAQQGKKS